METFDNDQETSAPDLNIPINTPAATKAIFSDIGLALKFGQPLHGYRLSSESFDLLSRHVASSAQYRRLSNSAAPFVLWAAERFRRSYDGGQYNWAFLTKSLVSEIDYQDLLLITRRGLTWFGRKMAKGDRGEQYYLKTLAAEGGLPESLMSDSEGRDRRLVRGLMSDIAKVGIAAPRELLLRLASSRATALPLGFRTEEFREQLLEFCVQLLEYRSKIPADVPSSARQAWLDNNIPDWKAKLPLRLESAGARSLLQDAMTSETSASKSVIATRILMRNEDLWIPRVMIAQKTEVPAWLLAVNDPQLRRIRLLPDVALSRVAPNLVLSAERDIDINIWQVRRETSARSASFRMELDQPVAFQMMAEGENIGMHVPPGGHALDLNDIPTIWAATQSDDDDKAQSLNKIGASSTKTRSPFLWVLSGEEAPRFDGLDVQQDGMIENYQLWKVSGQGRVFGDGWSLTLATSGDEDAVDRVLAHGPTISGLRDAQGMEIHRGLPSFFSQSADGIGRNLTSKNLCWRLAGRRNWKLGLPDASSCIGRYQIGWRDENNATRAFVSIRLLPATAKIHMSAAADGSLHFSASGLPLGTAVTLAESSTDLSRGDGTIQLALGAAAAHIGRIPVLFIPPENIGNPLKGTLPRPSNQGYFTDEHDHILPEDFEMDLGSLAGWRLILPPERSGELQMRLMSSAGTEFWKPILHKVRGELSLSTLLPLFQSLMAIGGPDSRLRLRVLVGGTESRRITLHRYIRAACWDGTALALTDPSEEISEEGMAVQCINLLAPELNTKLAGIQFNDDLPKELPNDRGPWLVFPKDPFGLIRPPRPLQRKVTGDGIVTARFSDGFEAAGCPSRRDDRIKAFVPVLGSLLDPMNIGDLSLYETQLDDLSDGNELSSLDSVSALARSPSTAAYLLLRAAPEKIEARLALEMASPFSWTTLPLSAWEAAVRTVRQQVTQQLLLANLPDYQARSFADDAVRRRVRDILDRRPELAGQLFLLAIGEDLLPTMTELGKVPPGLAKPRDTLMTAARRALAHHEGAHQQFDLRSAHAPREFEKLNQSIRGLSDAPLLAAEYVMGLRPHPPVGETAVAILHFRLHDQDYFETAMPAAIALLHSKNGFET